MIHDRQIELARLFLDGKMSFDEIVQSRKRTKNHIAGEIVFGALCLAERENDVRAAKLWNLFTQPGIGNIKAINKYNESFSA